MGKGRRGLPVAKVAIMVVRGQGFNLWLFYVNFSTREFLGHVYWKDYFSSGQYYSSVFWTPT